MTARPASAPAHQQARDGRTAGLPGPFIRPTVPASTVIETHPAVTPAGPLRCLALLAALGTCLLLAPLSASAQGILLYPRNDGSVAGVDVATSNIVTVIPAGAFLGANAGAQRNLAIDPIARLLWYAASDGNLYSFHLETLAAGPSLTNLPGANPSAERRLYCDLARGRIWVPIDDGSVAIFQPPAQTPVATIPASVFSNDGVGALRSFASDERDGTMWYAGTNSAFFQFDPATTNFTGRTIPFTAGAQTGTKPGANRDFVIDPLRNLLLYNITNSGANNGSIASVNLTTRLAGQFNLDTTVFSNGFAGATRPLAYDIHGLALTTTLGGATGPLSLRWHPLGTNVQYTLEFRTNVATGAWSPVPPTNQWPTAGTNATALPLSAPETFYRLRAEVPPN